MTAEVQWKPYVWDEPRPAPPDELDLLEKQWSVRLPEEYKKLVLTHQGMTPTPGIFNVGKIEDAMSVLLTIITDPKHKSYAISDSYSILKLHIPAKIYPFAMTPGCGHLCFDYRSSMDQPKIVLVTEEMYVYPVADSFTAFMNSLHDG
ncbi:SMI1/KNR4 family protein [Archangium sp.]|uniref:SMI1/KNR4 family protein n=1 Tax=Archangium sp. TaxID=1872627 RepID=UPI002D3CE1FD|nr:SMI1/KNR4 family protein [Archangium sp.]HYO57894.1 SMI1/KNR4 family protein [Archangium sp.]